MGLNNSSKRRPSVNGVTLSQVAKMAGVHPGTVSRALQGDERVTPATQEHIQRIAKELNYRPNIAARVLAKGKTQTIAVITGNPNEHHYGQVLHYLEQELTASGYKRLVVTKREGDLHSTINASSVDGVIAFHAFPHANELRTLGQDSPVPCVYAGITNTEWLNVDEVDLVEVDASEAVRQAVQTMLDSGCRRVAYIANNKLMTSTREVRAGVYSATLRAAGQQSEVINLEIADTTHLHDLLYERLTQYFHLHGCPDGLLCQNDEVAIVAQAVVKEFGMRIPDDVQIVGCDGLPYTKFLSPPLSTLVVPVQQACALAWQFLQNRLNDPTLARQHTVLKAQLRVTPSLEAAKH